MNWFLGFLALLGWAVAAYGYFRGFPKDEAGTVPGSSAELAEVREIVDSIYFNAFGPVGTHPDTLVDAFNKLWKWAGKEEKGIPKV